jgi:hypothetical protein
MATAAQITANQLNSQLSTGPRTEAGKQTVSRNASIHGLAAKKFFLIESDKPVFAELHAALTRHYQPATEHECALLEELAEAKWRCRTARTIESSFFELQVKEQRRADPSITEEDALARVFSDEVLQKRMRLMMRYLTSAERSAQKIRAELETVIAIRLEQEREERKLAAMRRRFEGRAADAAQPSSYLSPELVQNKANSPQRR